MELPKQLEELRDRKIWVNYLLTDVDGRLQRPKKPPVDPYTLKDGSSTDSSRWATFDQAYANIGKDATVYINDKAYTGLWTDKVAGVGITFEDNELFGIDLDHVVVDGKVTLEAQAIVGIMNSYTELSPSGTGIHILCKGSIPDGRRKVKNDDGTDYEIYDSGRYFTVTGKCMTGSTGVMERTAEAELVHKWAFSEPVKLAAAPAPTVASTRIIPSESDSELWDKMFNSERGREIRMLYDGDYSLSNGDRSVGDYVLMKDLAFWTGNDYSRMLSMMRQSAAGKRDDGKYLERTAERAIASTDTVRTLPNNNSNKNNSSNTDSIGKSIFQRLKNGK